MITKDNFTRINSDVNGNPRYFIHFLYCEPESWKSDPIGQRYANVCKLMNKIGGRKYYKIRYGSGIVFQSYSLDETIEQIERIKQCTNTN